MTDPEREHLLRENADLRRRLRGWRAACLILLGLLLLPVVLGGLFGMLWLPNLRNERVLFEEERRRAVDAQEESRQALDRALDEIAAQRKALEGREKAGAPRPAPEQQRP